MLLRFVLMVVIGGLIGWITNKVAIKMLFRPVNPKKILFFTLQGVFPKRKDQMAISLADTIESELLSKEVIMDKILNTDNLEEVKKDIMDTLVKKIAQSIPPMAKMFLGDNIEGMIRGYLDKEGETIFDELISKFKDSALDNLNIRDIVKDRIDSLDFVEFEKIVFGLMSRELKHIEVIGLFLGAIIGVFQYLITLI
jgi:uncharacterized membrane protein YheB (UPF0754 family)